MLRSRTRDLRPLIVELERRRERAVIAARRIGAEVRFTAVAIGLVAAASSLLAFEGALQRLRRSRPLLIDRARIPIASLAASSRTAIRAGTTRASTASVVLTLVFAELSLTTARRTREWLGVSSRLVARRGQELVERRRREYERMSAKIHGRLSRSARRARAHAARIHLASAESTRRATESLQLLGRTLQNRTRRLGTRLSRSAREARRRTALVPDRSRTAIRAARASLSISAASLRSRTHDAGARLLGTRRRARRAADRLLVDRIRSRLWLVTTHAGAIDVDVVDGRAILSGRVLAREVPLVVASVRAVEDIKVVEQAWQKLDESVCGVLTLRIG